MNLKAEMYWCRNCNVPLIGRECSKCGGMGIKIRISFPGDIRPALEHDYREIRLGIKFEVGEECYNKIFSGNPVLVNRIRYIDVMREVYQDGVRIGKVYYDPLIREWRFRFSYYGALRALENELLPRIKVDHEEFKGSVVFRRVDLPINSQVIVTNSSGRLLGVGYVREKYVKVREIFRSAQQPISDAKSNINDFIRANEHSLMRFEAKSLKLIDKVSSRFDAEVVTMFSGGKDSTVTLYLCLKAGLEPKVIYNNTGLEIPLVRDFVFKFIDRCGVELLESKPSCNFYDLMRRLGPPSVEYRWCTYLLKLIPTSKLIRDEFRRRVISIDGRRMYESLTRLHKSDIWTSSWIPNVLCVSPIRAWNQLVEWLYILANKIDYCPLYDECYERIGCFICPNCSLSEFEYVEKEYPELWSKWISELEMWRIERNLPREWIEYGLWRFLRPSSYEENLTSHLKIRRLNWRSKYEAYLNYQLKIRSCNQDDFELEIEVEEPIDSLHGLIGFLKTWGIDLKSGDLKIYLSSNSIIACGGLDLLEKFLASYYRFRLCTGCQNCTYWCNCGAIEIVDGKAKVLIEKCISCRICNYICPINESYVRFIALPYIRNDPYPKKNVDRIRVLKKVAYKRMDEKPIIREIAEVPWRVLLGEVS